MASEWKKHRIKDVVSFVVDNRGKTPPTQDEGNILLEVNAVSVTEKFPLYREVRKHVSQEVYDTRFRKGHPKKGDILVPTVGTLGAVSLMDRDDCCIAQNLIAIRCDEAICHSHFLYYVLCNPMTRKRLLNLNIGGVQPSIKVPHLMELDIELPSIQEQKKIAELLSLLDDKIFCNKRINDNLYAQARAITNQWITENDSDYELLPLNEVAVINPDTYSPKEEWKYVNYLDTSSITDGCIAEIQRISPSTEKLPSRARRKIVSNDVVFSTVRPNQRHFGIISEPLPNMLASTGFAVIRSKNPLVCNELIYLCLTDDAFIEKMQQLAEQSTSTFPSIKPSDLGVCEIPCPKDDSSSSLTETLKAMFSLIAANHRENASLAELRDSLLPRLMSGEIDVSDIQI